MIYYFDTNIFRSVAEGELGEDQIRRFLSALQSTDDCQVSPITIVELASHLNDLEKDKYPKYQAAFAAIELICKGRILPGPDSFLVKHLFSIESHEDVSNWDYFIRRILESKSLLELDSKVVEADLDGTRYLKKLSTEVLVNFREDYENNFLNDMVQHVIPHSNPGYSMTKTGVRDEPLRKKLLSLVDSKVFKRQFLEGLMIRVQRLSLSSIELSDDDVEKKIEGIGAFFTAYRTILRRIISTGYNYIEKKNDYADIHFLVYLMNPNFVFITHDQRLKNLVDDKCEQKGRIKSFEEALIDLEIQVGERVDIEKVKWEKEISEPNEVKVFKALSDPRWDFRTLAGISKVTGLTQIEIQNIFRKYPTFVRRSPISNFKEEDLFTLTSRAKGFKEDFEIIRSFLGNGRALQ